MSDTIVICDFDGTITKQDTLDLFLNKFATEEWKYWEKKWLAGEIGSRECIRKQFDLVENMTEKMFADFLDSVEIDDYFPKFYSLAKQKDIKVMIVSDGFDLIINTILKKYKLDDIEVYTNHLEFRDGKFIMEFPNINENCKKASGTCKCKIVNEYKNIYKTVYYVGDGCSDFCVSDKANYLFAKHRLLDYIKTTNLEYFSYNTFKEVIENDRLGLNV